jgi:hypothetical protein
MSKEDFIFQKEDYLPDSSTQKKVVSGPLTASVDSLVPHTVQMYQGQRL